MGSVNINTNTLPYTVRLSDRAKRLQIKVGHAGNVEIVVPKRMRQVDIHELLDEHREWITRARKRLLQSRAGRPHLIEPVPRKIELTALNESWTVVRRPGALPGIAIHENLRQLDLHFATNEEAKDLLRKWLHKRARSILNPWLQTVADRHGFVINKIFVKCQKSRWGSCSSQKNININRNLLFLPAELVEYLFVHELCHTKYLNHSARFWSLVSSIEPKYEKYEAHLNRAHGYIPLWALD